MQCSLEGLVTIIDEGVAWLQAHLSNCYWMFPMSMQFILVSDMAGIHHTGAALWHSRHLLLKQLQC